MNFFQKMLGAIFPPYKFSVARKEEGKLFNAIIGALPSEFEGIKRQLSTARLMGLDNWSQYPDFKFTTMGYRGESLQQSKKRGENYSITGIKIYSKRTRKQEDVTLLVHHNLVVGLKITNSSYQLSEYDLQQIDNRNICKSSFEFLPDEVDIFYDSLSEAVKEKLGPDNLSELEINNRLFYTFYDLEDGNYLAIDKKQNVYSLVHDARPAVSKMKAPFLAILDDIAGNRFDKQKHLDDRYKNSK